MGTLDSIFAQNGLAPKIIYTDKVQTLGNDVPA